MKISLALVSGLVGLSAAAGPLLRRQSVQNDVKSGSCKKYTLVFARASTEVGNMGGSMGPATCSGLKSKLGAGNVACQGVGGAYTAGLAENVSAKGTSEAAIKEAQSMLTQAATKCPQTILMAGGYSQGTAVMMNAIKDLDPAVRGRIAGVVLFGYTKNGQTKGSIPNFPTENLKVFCTKGDGVCWGQLNVSAGHFAYMGNGDGPAATAFLVSKANGFVPGAAPKGGDAPAAPAPKSPKGKGMGKGDFDDSSLKMFRS